MPLEILPSIDLRHGKIVRLQQGDYARQLDYDLDPLATARRFEDAGAKWIHIVDLDGAKEGMPAQVELIQRVIAATSLKAQVGGGVRSTDDVRRLVEIGASRVVVGTKAIDDWDWFSSLAREADFVGRITLAIDAKEGMIAVRGWTETSGRKAIDIAREVSDWPLAALLYTDVAKDGMMQGPNLVQTKALAEAGKVPVIASGGVRDLSHIRELAKLPVWGVIVGRSLHEGTLDLAEALRAGRGEAK